MEEKQELYENQEECANKSTANNCQCQEHTENETIVNEYKSDVSAEHGNASNGETGHVSESSKSNDNIYSSKVNDGNISKVVEEEEVNVAEASGTSKQHNNLEVSSSTTNYSTSEKLHKQVIAARNAEMTARCYAALDQRQQLFVPFFLLRMELVLLKFALIFIIITCCLLVMEITRSVYIATPQAKESSSSIFSISLFAIMRQKVIQ